MPSPEPRPYLVWGLIAVAVLLLALGGVVAALLLHTPKNVSHPSVSFFTHSTPAQRPAIRPVVNTFEWPRYGFDSGRTRSFTGARGLGPPLHAGWSFNDAALLEFPPVIYQDSLYLVDDNGSVKAIDKLDGRVLWQRRPGTLAAASPAIAAPQRLVLVPLLSTNRNAGQNPGNGRFVALSMATGRVVWSRVVPAGTESSPLAFGQNVYFGDQSGNVTALRARDGHLLWKYHAVGAVKGGPSLVGGVLYFGDYAGRAYALNAATGREIWAVGTGGSRFGFGSGQFYSTPAVAFGRVYMGNTDGRVYSFAARTGQLAWATGTGAYVYASPAVADIPGLGPTVYIGSYSGNLYAFDAQSGTVRWMHSAGGKISGSATIVGGVVYFSNLAARSTEGLDARTGQQVFSFPDGAFNPVICDYNAIYLSGYSRLYQLLPRRSAGTPTVSRPRSRGTAPRGRSAGNPRK